MKIRDEKYFKPVYLICYIFVKTHTQRQLRRNMWCDRLRYVWVKVLAQPIVDASPWVTFPSLPVSLAMKHSKQIRTKTIRFFLTRN